MILPGLPHGQEKSGNQEKLNKMTKILKSQVKIRVIEIKSGKIRIFFFNSDFFSLSLQNSLYLKALDW